jgi:transcriptional regulator with XRE-family HTH domain
VSAIPKKSGKSDLENQRKQWRRAAAAVIAATRRDKDMTQDQFASLMGWSHDTVANLESGRRKIELGDLVMAAIVLDEEPNTLIQRVLQWNVRDRRSTRK